MKITPALPNPYQSPADPNRQVVRAVHASGPARDAADEADRRHERVPRVDPLTHERLAAQIGPDPRQRDGAMSARAHKALASYARVAGEDQKQDLQRLLGFDAYA